MYLEEKQLILTRKRTLSIHSLLKFILLRVYQFSDLSRLTLSHFYLRQTRSTFLDFVLHLNGSRTTSVFDLQHSQSGRTTLSK
jgi:hypothetical protein